MRTAEIKVSLAQKGIVSDWMRHGQTLILSTGRLNKIDQCQPLTIRAGINQGFMSWVCNNRSCDATGCADRIAEICTRQSFANPLKREEEKRFVLLDRSANRAAELLATKILERFAS